MIVKKNEIFTLWIKNAPTCLQFLCWNSWINLGYRVVLYTDDLTLFSQMPLNLKRKIYIKLLKTLENALPSFDFVINKENLLQFTDVWRFIYLFYKGGTWLDSDIFLFKRLPDSPIIISSERTYQSGGRKCKDLYRPNIGVLRFPPHHPFLKAVINKIKPITKEDENPTKNCTSKMIKFQKLLKLKKWSNIYELISNPNDYCPIDAPFAVNIYYSDCESVINEKYGLKWNNDLSNSYGCHLWANICRLKNIDFEKTHENSLFKKLLKM